MPLKKVNPLEMVTKKKPLREKVGGNLTETQKKKAKKDPHSKRTPRWCGITIHIAENCPWGCTYCYIRDMGFQFGSPTPSNLNGEELVFSLLNNRSFLPGKGGTLLALGAVSDPFLFPEKTVEYLRHLSTLGNPLQFATKAFISRDLAVRLSKAVKNKKSELSPLVTIVTLSYTSELEGNAPSPEKRFKTIENLAEAGLQPVLFFRPVIPGVNDKEGKVIMKKAEKAGAVGVVIGSFRATASIITRLEEKGVPTSKVRRRLKTIDERQRPVPLPERGNLLKAAREKGLIPWRTTCCANSFQSNAPCPSTCYFGKFCTNCPNECSFPEDVPPKSETEKALNFLRLNGKVEGDTVILYNAQDRNDRMLVRNLSRRKVVTKNRFSDLKT